MVVMMKQKFFRGQRVMLSKKFPIEMSHFGGKGCDAIVVGSYSDLCGYGNFSDFQLLIFPKRGKAYTSAWYPERLLTLLSDDRREGEKRIQEYNESELFPVPGSLSHLDKYENC